MESTPVGVIIGLFQAISQKLPAFTEWETQKHHHLLNSNPDVCNTMTEVRQHVTKYGKKHHFGLSTPYTDPFCRELSSHPFFFEVRSQRLRLLVQQVSLQISYSGQLELWSIPKKIFDFGRWKRTAGVLNRMSLRPWQSLHEAWEMLTVTMMIIKINRPCPSLFQPFFLFSFPFVTYFLDQPTLQFFLPCISAI